MTAWLKSLLALSSQDSLKVSKIFYLLKICQLEWWCLRSLVTLSPFTKYINSLKVKNYLKLIKGWNWRQSLWPLQNMMHPSSTVSFLLPWKNLLTLILKISLGLLKILSILTNQLSRFQIQSFHFQIKKTIRACLLSLLPGMIRIASVPLMQGIKRTLRLFSSCQENLDQEYRVVRFKSSHPLLFHSVIQKTIYLSLIMKTLMMILMKL